MIFEKLNRKIKMPNTISDNTLEDFLQYVDIDKLIKTKCCCCNNKTTYLVVGIRLKSFPTFSGYCKTCIKKEDFDDMITSQILPSTHSVYDLVNKKFYEKW